MPSPVRPAADAIWLGRRSSDGQIDASYHRTREAVFEKLAGQLEEEVARSRRVFLGVDFALGYPAGFADAAGLGGADKPWQRTWRYLAQHIEDGPDNANNRFTVAADLNQLCSDKSHPPSTPEKRTAPKTPSSGGGGGGGPFWGCPPTQAGPWLSPRRDRVDSPLPRRRLVEQRMASAHEVWKLYTTGSVGSQTLLGITRLAKLRERPALKNHLRVWPFETGFTSDGFTDDCPGIVVAEVYPSLVNDRADDLLASRTGVTVKDQAQVLALAEYFGELDHTGGLLTWFEMPPGLLPDAAKQCVDEEGWIFGVRDEK